jgi:hypothetical protein
LDPLQNLDFTPTFENVEVDYQEGTDHEVTLHDGSRITLHKLKDDYDPTDKESSLKAIHAAVAEGKFLTGLIYYNPGQPDFTAQLNLCNTPLSELGQDILRPPAETLDQINAEMMK